MKTQTYRNKNLLKKSLLLMLPIMMQQLISLGINFLDNIMIGHLGEIQIAAVSQSNQFHNIVFYVCMGLGSGAIVMTSQFWGAGDRKALKSTSTLALRITFIITFVFSVITLIFPEFILSLFSNDPEVIAAGVPYIRVLGVTFILNGLSSVTSYLLRSVNTVNIPFIGSLISFFINIFFNWVFIYGKLGAPALGIFGAGIGTLIARAFEFCFIFGYLIKLDKKIMLRFSELFASVPAEIKQKYIQYGAPLLISDTSLGVSLAVVAALTGHINKEITTATSIVNTLIQMVSIFNASMAGASAVVIGNSIGEGDIHGAKKESQIYIIFSFIMGCVLIFPLLAIEGPYVSLYALSDTTKAIVHDCIVVNCLFFPVQLLAYVTSKGILRGGGDTRFLLFWDTATIWFVSIPLGALAGFVWHLSPFWIYFCLRVEYPLKGIICLIRYFSGKWLHVIKVNNKN